MLRRRGAAADETSSLLTRPVAAFTEHERDTLLDTLRQRVAQPFADNDKAHTQFLHDIWDSTFPLETFQLSSEQWKVLGFQGKDPRTDLRGAGVCGLKHLRSYFRSFPAADFMEMFEDFDPLSSLPIAIASINCTAMLLSHLQLAPKLTCAFLPGGRSECAPDILHGFLSLGLDDSDGDGGDGGAAVLDDARATRLERALEAMHLRLLLHLTRTWKAMGAKRPVNLMDFPDALRATFAHLQAALQAVRKEAVSGASTSWRLEEVTLALEREYNAGAGKGFNRGGGDDAFSAACDCVVKPAEYLMWATYDAACGLFNSVLGTCGLQVGGGGAHRKRT